MSNKWLKVPPVQSTQYYTEYKAEHGVVAHTYSPSTQEAEVGESLELRSWRPTSLGNLVRPGLKTTTNKFRI
jgi:hypothetical protein